MNTARRQSVSAIVPNYNDAVGLVPSISALQGQLGECDEILIVDDASTDSSRDVMASIAASDSRVRLFYHPENVGPIAAINTGLREARGDCVVLGSANDILAKGFVESLLSALTSNPDAAFVCGEMRLIENGRMVGIRPITRLSSRPEYFSPARTAAALMRCDNLFLTGASILVRERLRGIGFLREELGSFADGFALRVLALRYGFVFVPKIVSEWHVDSNSISRRTAASPSTARSLLQAADAAFRSDPVFPFGYPELFARRWSFSVLRLALSSKERSSVVFEFAPGKPWEKSVLDRMSSLGPPGRFSTLAWCAVRYRPYPVLALMQTAEAIPSPRTPCAKSALCRLHVDANG